MLSPKGQGSGLDNKIDNIFHAFALGRSQLTKERENNGTCSDYSK
jgi:hypothetical protein